jgi:hypothetical protein
VISAATLAPTALVVGEQARISVAAGDPDGDALTFHYTAQRGAVTPDPANAATAMYTPARSGADLIVVAVSDSHGASDVRHLTVFVEGGDRERPARIRLQPPAMNGVIVIAPGAAVRVDLCDESPSSFEILWGDGEAAAGGCAGSHVYAAAGLFQLVVSASGVAVGEARKLDDYRQSFVVNVIPPGAPPGPPREPPPTPSPSPSGSPSPSPSASPSASPSPSPSASASPSPSPSPSPSYRPSNDADQPAADSSASTWKPQGGRST